MNIDHLNPCIDVAEWLLTQPDAQTAWDACERPDWMLWYLEKTGCSQQTLVTIACRIARTVVHLAPPEALTAIEAAERWALDPSEENRAALAAARAAAYDAADAAAYAAAAYATAADAAAYAAAYTAAYTANAAHAAAYAADAADADAAAYAADAADAAWAANAAAREEHCRIIREIVPVVL